MMWKFIKEQFKIFWLWWDTLLADWSYWKSKKSTNGQNTVN